MSGTSDRRATQRRVMHRPAQAAPGPPRAASLRSGPLERRRAGAGVRDGAARQRAGTAPASRRHARRDHPRLRYASRPSEVKVAGANLTVCGVSACMLLAGSIVLGQQDRELSGINGLPVEGHDIVASIQFVGTKEFDPSRSGKRGFKERLRANGAELRLGWPLEYQTLCRFKEVVRDVLSEKGFVDAEVTHDANPTRGNRRHVALTFTIVEGKRSHGRPRETRYSPAERCMR